MSPLHHAVAVHELLERLQREMQAALYYKDTKPLITAAKDLAVVLVATMQQPDQHRSLAQPLYYALAMQDLLERLARRMQHTFYYKDQQLLVAAARTLAVVLTNLIRQQELQRTQAQSGKRST